MEIYRIEISKTAKHPKFNIYNPFDRWKKVQDFADINEAVQCCKRFKNDEGINKYHVKNILNSEVLFTLDE